MAQEYIIQTPEQSRLERDAHKWRVHQTEHLLLGTLYSKPLTCDLDCPMRADDDDADDDDDDDE